MISLPMRPDEFPGDRGIHFGDVDAHGVKDRTDEIALNALGPGMKLRLQFGIDRGVDVVQHGVVLRRDVVDMIGQQELAEVFRHLLDVGGADGLAVNRERPLDIRRHHDGLLREIDGEHERHQDEIGRQQDPGRDHPDGGFIIGADQT